MNRLWLRDWLALQSNVYARQDGAVHQVWQVPPQWLDSNVVFGAFGGNIWVLFGIDAAVVVNPAAFSAGPPAGILTPSPNTGDRIAEDTVTRIYVPRGFREGNPAAGTQHDITHYAIIGDTEVAAWFAYAVTEAHLD